MATNESSLVPASRSEVVLNDVVSPNLRTRENRAIRPRHRRHSTAAYFTINLVFIVIVFMLSLAGQDEGHNPALYLVLLMALLSSPLLFVQSLTGPYLVLVISTPFFFTMFGLGDLVGYVSDTASLYVTGSHTLISKGELGVLAGILSLFIGYTAAVGTLRRKSARWLVAEWPAKKTFLVGLAFFTAGMIATFIFQVRWSVSQVDSTHTESALFVNSLVLGRMVGELGEILLAYVLVKTRSKAITIFILGLIAFKLPLGIILNSKYIGVSFIVIYVVVAWIFRKRLPWKIMLVGGLAISLMFPLAYTYRAYMGKYYVSVGETLEDISGNLSKALSEEVTEQQERGLMDAALSGLTSVAERANMKPTVELIMARAGKDIPYKNGYTLTPLLYVLIPRMILPDKPDVPVGQIFNRDFKISLSPDTWISTSFIGEFYWNFSWIGIIAGMLVVGYTYGAVGSITSLETRTNVVRILIILITIATLVFKFQTGIAQQYSIFIRSLFIVVFLHMLLRERKQRSRTVLKNANRYQ